MNDDYDHISNGINQWFAMDGRELPWRGTQDPYTIWLSEIILQQTRVEQGTPYFLRFTEAFPTVQDLANASEDEVLKLWQGLGYYSRARNLHASAKYVVDHMGGKFPNSHKDLLKLMGVGGYTAAAVSSISSNERVAAIDGNVNRVVSRLFGIEEATHTSKFKAQIEELSEQLLSKQEPRKHNQAMMDFGALMCTPKNPSCAVCPVSKYCYAFQNNKVGMLPHKQKKNKKTDRYFHFGVIQSGDKTILEKRDNSGIWAGLWQFPLIETKSNKVLDLDDFKSICNAELTRIIKVKVFQKHVLSHQNIFSIFYLIEANGIEEDHRNIPIHELSNVALPRLIDRFLEHHSWQTKQEK